MKKTLRRNTRGTRETPIERIFREEAGRVMTLQERIIFLGRPKKKAKVP